MKIKTRSLRDHVFAEDPAAPLYCACGLPRRNQVHVKQGRVQVDRLLLW